MSRLGIDYGTTNTVVVCSDRGRYPVVPHLAETAVGPVSREIFPSLAVQDRETGEFLFGPAAERSICRPGAGERYCVIRSLKRLIRHYTEGARVGHEMVPSGFDPALVLRRFAEALRASIQRSGLFSEREPLEVTVTWPANANGAQRYLTRRCFREAGFEILSTLNEPTAAAIEFADRLAKGNRTAARRQSMSVAVFDLGGGTFDVSLVKVDGTEFTVLEALGIEQLGGDDFDEVLSRSFLRELGIKPDALTPFQRVLLLRHACQQKESIGSGSLKTLTLAPNDIGLKGNLCAVPVAAYLGEVKELLKPAAAQLWEIVNGKAASAAGISADSLDAIYLVGGSSGLPLVPRMVAERFPGVRLIMSDKPFSSTAMGAAIHCTEAVRLHDILSRTFGVLRLAENGSREYFSPIFPAGTRLPSRNEPPLECTVEYSPYHNIGHLRYMECAALDGAGRPSEGIRHWSEAAFPYDPSIPAGAVLTPDRVVSRPDIAGLRARESYTCDSDGVITARITRLCDGHSCSYEVFRRGE